MNISQLREPIEMPEPIVRRWIDGQKLYDEEDVKFLLDELNKTRGELLKTLIRAPDAFVPIFKGRYVAWYMASPTEHSVMDLIKSRPHDQLMEYPGLWSQHRVVPVFFDPEVSNLNGFIHITEQGLKVARQMTNSERIQNLRNMYWKYKERGLDIAAERTAARIRELGGEVESGPEGPRGPLSPLEEGI